MKLIHNMVTIPINEHKYLLVNALNGLIDEIDIDTYNIIQAWSEERKVNPLTDIEKVLFEAKQAVGGLGI